MNDTPPPLARGLYRVLSPENRHARRRRRVYTIPQFADEMGISERTVWRLIAAGKIKTIDVSLGRRAITDEELERIATRGIAR